MYTDWWNWIGFPDWNLMIRYNQLSSRKIWYVSIYHYRKLEDFLILAPQLRNFVTLHSTLRCLACVWQQNCDILGRERRSNGGSIPTEPLLCCFIPRGLIHWMFKDDRVTIGDQMGLTTGWKCEECLLNWCSWDEQRREGEQRWVKGLSVRHVHNDH